MTRDRMRIGSNVIECALDRMWSNARWIDVIYDFLRTFTGVSNHRDTTLYSDACYNDSRIILHLVISVSSPTKFMVIIWYKSYILIVFL